jgi:nitroreductase
MSFLELARKRQSCRKYDPEKRVSREKIERCIEAARLAPSACNSQPWFFIIVDDPEIKDKVARATFGKVIGFNHFTMQAPVLAVIVTEKANLTSFIGTQIKGIQYRLIDIGIAAEHFCLQAAGEGLGSCMLGWFDEKAVKKVLNIPSRRSVDLIISLGYSADDTLREKKRKPIEEIRRYNLD